MTDDGDGDEHPLYGIVGMLDEKEAERVRRRCEEFREDFSEEISETFDES
jgi:hypothetical protein